jgi:hypothetical protein
MMSAEELTRIGTETEEFFRTHGVVTNACRLPEQR